MPGLQGLAVYWLNVEATAYLSDDGDASARFEAEYDLLLTQRLILQPRVEVNVAFSRVESIGIGQGFNDVALGLRLRYEIKREFAPYVGVNEEDWLAGRRRTHARRRRAVGAELRALATRAKVGHGAWALARSLSPGHCGAAAHRVHGDARTRSARFAR